MSKTERVLTVDERAALVIGHGLLQGLAEPDGLQQLVPGLQRVVATLLARTRTEHRRRWPGRRWRRARQACRRRRRRRRRRKRHGCLQWEKQTKANERCRKSVVRDNTTTTVGPPFAFGDRRRSEDAVWRGRTVRVMCVGDTAGPTVNDGATCVSHARAT